MKSYRGALIKDTIFNIFFVFALVTIVGMFSNVILLAVGYMISVPMSQNGYNDTNTQALWFFLASISMIACIFAVYGLTKLVGASAAQLRISYQLEYCVNVPEMLVSVTVGNLLHAVACVGLSWATLSYLVIAGPVQYIARFIGHGKMSIFSDIALDFSHGIVLGSIAIYSICLTAASFVGYVHGHRKKLRQALKKAEEEEREKNKAAEAWSREDAEKSADPDTYMKEEKPKIVRTKLDRRTEEAFRALNKKRMITTAAGIVLWTAAVILFAAYWIPKTGREILSPYSAPFTVLLMLPFWPFRLHQRFIGKTGYATVAKASVEHRARVMARGRVYQGMGSVAVGVLMLRLESGESIQFDIPAEMVPYYEKDEKVFRLPAFKYPVKCSYDYDEEVFCPSCGLYTKVGRKKCPKCGTAYVRTR